MSWLFSLELAFALIGALMLLAAQQAWQLAGDTPSKCRALFWSLWALILIGGSYWRIDLLGAMVIAAALLSVPAFKANTSRAEAAEAAESLSRVSLSARLLHPALLLPLCVMVFFLTLKLWPPAVLDQKLSPLVALQYAAISVLMFACIYLRFDVRKAVQGGASMTHQLGWPIVLPLMLAVLGAVFVKAGVGDALSSLLSRFIPNQNAYVCLLAYVAMMVLLTLLLGNAFAAFPVAFSAIGMPWVVKLHGGDPVALASIGMLCGYCGTLMTPMAANFNTVPAVLMNIEPRRLVIYAQIPSALAILTLNTLLLMWAVYR